MARSSASRETPVEQDIARLLWRYSMIQGALCEVGRRARGHDAAAFMYRAVHRWLIDQRGKVNSMLRAYELMAHELDLGDWREGVDDE